VTVMRPLESGDPGVVNHKSPTSLLLDPDGEFHSFGFRARDFYHDLSPKEARNWLYFDKFKMPLHNAKVGHHELFNFFTVSGATTFIKYKHRHFMSKYAKFDPQDHRSRQMVQGGK